MRTITPSLNNNLYNHIQGNTLQKSSAYPVNSYRELVQNIAELAYLNRDYLLFFRGQSRDFRNKAGSSTIYPSIYRGERVSSSEIELRFDTLNSFSSRLCDEFETQRLTGHIHIKRRKYIQWSILQHYEVCSTPLLDLTHSILVACSFAFHSSKNGDPYFFIFGLPYLTNRISINTEQDIVNIRLLSICPPDALRPYFQDGYLAGTDEITTEYISKDELDFNNRLIAKFKLINSKNFWGNGFNAIPKNVLYPEKDMVNKICDKLKLEGFRDIPSSKVGLFLKNWLHLEYIILSSARQYKEKVYNIREALNYLESRNLLPPDILDKINNLRTIRNLAVHEPKRLELETINFAIHEIDKIVKELNP